VCRGGLLSLGIDTIRRCREGNSAKNLPNKVKNPKEDEIRVKTSKDSCKYIFYFKQQNKSAYDAI
jgi:hypothetical protein